MGFYFDGSGQRTHRNTNDEREHEDVESLRPSPGKSSRTHGGGDVRGIPGKVSLTMRLAQRIDQYRLSGQPPMLDEYVRAMIAETRNGASQPLPVDLRHELEAHAGTNLADGRAHTGAASDNTAQAIPAEASTAGKDVHFAARSDTSVSEVTQQPPHMADQWLAAPNQPDLHAPPVPQSSEGLEFDEPSAASDPDIDLSSSAMAQRMSDIVGRAFQQTVIRAADQAPRETLDARAQTLIDNISPGLDISVHRGGTAGKALDAAGTPAAAVGSHILFSNHAPSLDSAAGQHILAHEAVHTAQQRGHTPDPTRTPSRAAESEAERLANHALAGRAIAGISHAPAISFVGADAVVEKVTRRALAWLAKRGKNISAHTFRRHVAKNMAKYAGKSKFLNAKTAKQLAEKTLKDPDNVIDQGRRLVFEKEFGREIGRGQERILRVVVDKATGKIVTAFPSGSFKAVTSAAAVAATTTAASRADAKIEARRKRIQEMLEPGMVESIIDFLVGPSRIARSEDALAEDRIIRAELDRMLNELESAEGQCFPPDIRQELIEMMMTELRNTPQSG